MIEINFELAANYPLSFESCNDFIHIFLIFEDLFLRNWLVNRLDVAF